MEKFIFGLVILSFTAFSADKPNIIFIMADDLGYRDLGCYGQEKIKTPNLNRMASEGMKFTQCYTGAPVCAPARSTLMTGQHSGHTRVRGNFGKGGVKGLGGAEGRVPLKEEDITVAQVLKSAGYVTGMMGKWGLGEPNTSGEPHKKGWDEFVGFLNQRRAHTYYPKYIWRNTEKYELPGNYKSPKTDYTHDIFTEESLKFIERNHKQSFFLYIPYCVPHNKYEIPSVGEYEDENWSDDEKVYAAMISRMDSGIGRILNLLKKLRIDKKTYVFFTSDNGAAKLWENIDSSGSLRGIKRDVYEGGIRVPMIAWAPDKIPAGKVSDLQWYFPDVLPTFAELASTEAPANVDGVSVVPFLHGQSQVLNDRVLYWEFYEKQGSRAVRFGDWKAVQYGMNKKPGKIELYNLKNDLSESEDIALKHPEIIARVEKIFEREHQPSEHYIWKSRIKSR